MIDDRRKEVVSPPAGAGWAGRDAGKTFLIQEWYADRAERWAWGMFFALKGTGSQIPLDVARLGMVAVGVRVINTVLAADVDYSKIDPFMSQLIDECVTIVRDRSVIDKATGLPAATPLLQGDISEMATRTWLRSEVIRLHTNFSVFDSLSGLVDQIRTWMPPSTEISETTSTSPPSLDESSPSTPG